MDEDEIMVAVSLSAGEVELIRNALGYLEDTLSREEAEELAAVQALLAKLERLGSS
jgi:hypothetical protein